MSAALHIADNYNDVVDVITSLTAIYERTISVEPTLQQATNKQHLLYGCSAIELSDLQDHYNNLIRTISGSFAVDLEYPQPHRLFDPTP